MVVTTLPRPQGIPMHPMKGAAKGPLDNGSSIVDRVNDEEFENEKGSCVIRQESSFRQSWDFVITVSLLYICIFLPLLLAYVDTPSTFVFSVDYAIDVIFLCDVPLNFFTTYTDSEGQEIFNNAVIAKHYLRGWFFIDFISSIRFEWVVDNSLLRSSKAIKVLRMMKLIKMLRMTKMARIIPKIQSKFEIKNASLSIIKFATLIVLTAHWLGCFFFMTARIEGFPDDSWTNVYQARAGLSLADASLGSQYMASMYWAFSTMSTIGFGDIIPGTDFERSFASIAMCVGAGIFAYAVTNMASMIFNYNQQKVQFTRMQDSLKDMLESKRISLFLRKKIRGYLFFKQLTSSVALFDESQMLAVLSPSLRAGVSVEILNNLNINTILFHRVPVGFVVELAQVLNGHVYAPGEAIVREGHDVFDVCMVAMGKVRVFSRVPEVNFDPVLARKLRSQNDEANKVPKAYISREVSVSESSSANRMLHRHQAEDYTDQTLAEGSGVAVIPYDSPEGGWTGMVELTELVAAASQEEDGPGRQPHRRNPSDGSLHNLVHTCASSHFNRLDERVRRVPTQMLRISTKASDEIKSPSTRARRMSSADGDMSPRSMLGSASPGGGMSRGVSVCRNDSGFLNKNNMAGELRESTLYAGASMNEVACLLGGTSTLSAFCASHVDIYTISRTDLRDICEEMDPNLMLVLKSLVVDHFRRVGRDFSVPEDFGMTEESMAREKELRLSRSVYTDFEIFKDSLRREQFRKRRGRTRRRGTYRSDDVSPDAVGINKLRAAQQLGMIADHDKQVVNEVKQASDGFAQGSLVAAVAAHGSNLARGNSESSISRGSKSSKDLETVGKSMSFSGRLGAPEGRPPPVIIDDDEEPDSDASHSQLDSPNSLLASINGCVLGAVGGGVSSPRVPKRRRKRGGGGVAGAAFLPPEMQESFFQLKSTEESDISRTGRHRRRRSDVSGLSARLRSQHLSGQNSPTSVTSNPPKRRGRGWRAASMDHAGRQALSPDEWRSSPNEDIPPVPDNMTLAECWALYVQTARCLDRVQSALSVVAPVSADDGVLSVYRQAVGQASSPGQTESAMRNDSLTGPGSAESVGKAQSGVGVAQSLYGSVQHAGGQNEAEVSSTRVSPVTGDSPERAFGQDSSGRRSGSSVGSFEAPPSKDATAVATAVDDAGSSESSSAATKDGPIVESDAKDAAPTESYLQTIMTGTPDDDSGDDSNGAAENDKPGDSGPKRSLVVVDTVNVMMEDPVSANQENESGELEPAEEDVGSPPSTEAIPTRDENAAVPVASDGDTSDHSERDFNLTVKPSDVIMNCGGEDGCVILRDPSSPSPPSETAEHVDSSPDALAPNTHLDAHPTTLLHPSTLPGAVADSPVEHSTPGAGDASIYLDSNVADALGEEDVFGSSGGAASLSEEDIFASHNLEVPRDLLTEDTTPSQNASDNDPAEAKEASVKSRWSASLEDLV